MSNVDIVIYKKNKINKTIENRRENNNQSVAFVLAIKHSNCYYLL